MQRNNPLLNTFSNQPNPYLPNNQQTNFQNNNQQTQNSYLAPPVRSNSLSRRNQPPGGQNLSRSQSFQSFSNQPQPPQNNQNNFSSPGWNQPLNSFQNNQNNAFNQRGSFDNNNYDNYGQQSFQNQNQQSFQNQSQNYQQTQRSSFQEPNSQSRIEAARGDGANVVSDRLNFGAGAPPQTVIGEPTIEYRQVYIDKFVEEPQIVNTPGRVHYDDSININITNILAESYAKVALLLMENNRIRWLEAQRDAELEKLRNPSKTDLHYISTQKPEDHHECPLCHQDVDEPLSKSSRHVSQHRPHHQGHNTATYQGGLLPSSGQSTQGYYSGRQSPQRTSGSYGAAVPMANNQTYQNSSSMTQNYISGGQPTPTINHSIPQPRKSSANYSANSQISHPQVQSQYPGQARQMVVQETVFSEQVIDQRKQAPKGPIKLPGPIGHWFRNPVPV